MTTSKKGKTKWLTLGALLGTALLPVVDILGLLPPAASRALAAALAAVLGDPAVP